jgi:DNA-binding transcriptional regulator YdaS (Cro superfamily)
MYATIVVMNPMQKAVAVAGSASSLARQLGVTPQAVIFWADGSRSLPIAKLAEVERLTGISRKDFCPNDWIKIWPELASRAW